MQDRSSTPLLIRLRDHYLDAEAGSPSRQIECAANLAPGPMQKRRPLAARRSFS
jgi:hypothetical protein